MTKGISHLLFLLPKNPSLCISFIKKKKILSHTHTHTCTLFVSVSHCIFSVNEPEGIYTLILIIYWLRNTEVGIEISTVVGVPQYIYIHNTPVNLDVHWNIFCWQTFVCYVLRNSPGLELKTGPQIKKKKSVQYFAVNIKVFFFFFLNSFLNWKKASKINWLNIIIVNYIILQFIYVSYYFSNNFRKTPLATLIASQLFSNFFF